MSSRINSQLFNRLQKRLGVGTSQTYKRIDEKVREAALPRRLAAIALAAEHGINISRYASPEDLAQVRGARTVPPTPEGVTESPAAYSRPAKRKASTRRRHTQGGKTVFVVHGRNDKLRRSMFGLLRALGLRPLEWNQAIQATGSASPHIGEILEAAFRRAAAVVVLLSPDDEVRLKEHYRRRSDPPEERRLVGQARPNVLFEAGMAFGSHPDKTVLVEVGRVKRFSDVAGRHVVRMTNSATRRNELVAKLKAAGCEVDNSGNDWLKEGDFTT